MSEVNHCPVCDARFRGAINCSRCGADLSRLMLLSAEAWRKREAARNALAAGEFDTGWTLAAEAQQAQRTESGNLLLNLCAWLSRA